MSKTPFEKLNELIKKDPKRAAMLVATMNNPEGAMASLDLVLKSPDLDRETRERLEKLYANINSFLAQRKLSEKFKRKSTND